MNATRSVYFDIYKSTYWGSSDGSILVNDDIIRNRDNFINDYGIKSYENKWAKYLQDIICLRGIVDHVEVYNTLEGDDYVVISSPYGLEKPMKHIEYGWEEIYKLYTIDARTFMKKIPKRRKR